MAWRAALGAWPEGEGSRFRVWAPAARTLEVVVEKGGCPPAVHPLSPVGDGYFSDLLAGLHAGDRYSYRVNGTGPFPDPASRHQPGGVHGPSEIVDPSHFVWTDASWNGVPRDELVIYELHVGTFSPEGTFAGATERLPYLCELGVTAVELMPLADFPGQRNWGYDGVDLFAPARCYGRPDDLRRLVNEAHRLGLAVLIDVVYNHLGPDGNYLAAFSPFYFTKKHRTNWGDALNFDGERSEHVRAFFIENALCWIHEYHFDGLRLDATHAIQDDSPRKFLAELRERVHASVSHVGRVFNPSCNESGQPREYGDAGRVENPSYGREVAVIAEEHGNLAYMVKPPAEGGWGLDGMWIDDFHHQVRCLLVGDKDGYFSDYTGAVRDLAETIRQGWFYRGQYSAHLKQPRGTDPTGIPPRRLVYCIQNHDQIGNRAFGERLNAQIEPAAFAAASVLLLCAPATPLLFMGQEWAASTPFLFFTDHNEELGRLVSEGRRQEFRHFAAFADPEARQRIPDPQAPATFACSRLKWEEQTQEPHASMLRLYKALLHLRRTEPSLRSTERDSFTVTAVNDSAIVLERTAADGRGILVVVQLVGTGVVGLSQIEKPLTPRTCWVPVLSTENEAYSADPKPPKIGESGGAPVIQFCRPGAVILRNSQSL